MATIASGTLTREGETVTATPGARLSATDDDSVMSYSITQVDAVAQPRVSRDGWEHFTYLFTYRLLGGRTFAVTWRGGMFWTSAEVAKPEHAHNGLESAFRDAASIEYDSFQDWASDMGYDLSDRAEYRRAEVTYYACERTGARLEAFIGTEHYQAWQTATAED